MRDRSSFRGGAGYRRNALIVGALLFVALVTFLLDTQGVLSPVRAYLTNSVWRQYPGGGFFGWFS